MSRRIILACVAVGLALVGVLLVIGGIAWTADPQPMLDLKEPLSPPPVYSIDVGEGLTLAIPVSNTLPSPAQVTVTAKLVNIFKVTTGEPAADMFSLSPVSQTVRASEVLTFTLSLKEQPSVTGLYTYTGTLRFSTTGPDPSLPITTTQPFTLTVLASAEERGGQTVTPTLSLRLVGSYGELLSSPPVYRVLVSDEGGWQSTELGVRNLGSEELTIAAGPLTVTSDTGEFVPATLGLLPVSQTVAANEVVTFTLSLTEGWVPIGKCSASLQFSAEGIGSVAEPFVLLVSPWEAELEWAQEEFVYEADEAHTEATIQFIARHAGAKDIRAQLPTVAPRDALSVPFSTMNFLRIEPPLLPTLTQDKVATLTLNFITSTLPTPGTYNGEFRLSASNAAPITATFTLVVPDTARGLYELVIAELGQSPSITTSATLPLTTALQFTGVRWLPAATIRADWWPILAGAILLGVGVFALVGYTIWGLAGLAPKVVAQKTGIKGWLQKAWSWIRRHPKASLGLLAGALVLVVVTLSLSFDLTQAHVGDRNLLIWEAKGRGPVRKMAVLGGEVVNQVGDWGKIRIGGHDGKIEAGDVVTVPDISIEDLSQPGVYQGHILIQSPDIAKGLVEVPVQVTIHDLIFWPALVILLGVIAGGWVKYQQEIASQLLGKRKDIEEAWQRWDDYMLQDDYLWPPSAEGERNPIYEKVWWDLRYARELLAQENEWGIEDADEIVSDVGKRLTTYQRLAKAVADWRDEQKREGDKTSQGQLKEWIDEAEKALCRGELDQATNLIGKLARKTLPIRIGQLDNLAKTVTDEKAKTAIQALLTEAKNLYIKGDHGQAWLKFKEADFQIRAQGIDVPFFAPGHVELGPILQSLVDLRRVAPDRAASILKAFAEPVVGVLDFEQQMRLYLNPEERTFVRQILGLEGYADLPAPEPEERYVIRSPGWIRRSARDTMLFRIEYEGKNPPQGVEFQWNIQPGDAAEPAPERGTETRVEFHEEGLYEVMVTVQKDGVPLPNKQPDPLELQIGPSGMEAIYQAKRRHNFNRRLAALLLALVAGIGAKRIFGLTFGSFEEYLGAFAWGVGVSLGIDPAANGYQSLRDWVQTGLLKVREKKKTT